MGPTTTEPGASTSTTTATSRTARSQEAGSYRSRPASGGSSATFPDRAGVLRGPGLTQCSARMGSFGDVRPPPLTICSFAFRGAGGRNTAYEPVFAQGERIRWYNPKLGGFEWREVPASDNEALAVLAGSPHTPACRETYREWRALGASIAAALIRAGEGAREASRGSAPGAGG